MEDTYDNADSLIPTMLDRERLDSMVADESVTGEYGTWTVCKYPPKKDRPTWCEYTLLVNHPQLPGRGSGYELKNLKALFSFMDTLDGERKKKP